MWESRVLCEISKSLWKPFLGFQRDVISTAVSRSRSPRPTCTLAGLSVVVPGASYAVVSDQPNDRIAHRRRFGSKGPAARPRRDGFGAGPGGDGRERSVR
jgi:hypothetical protein